MHRILCLNKISPVGTDRFGSGYEYAEDTQSPDGILVRSASMHEMTFGENLKAIARAGAGVNNIPVEACTEQGIVVFNTPGANANAVKELVIASLFLTSRKIIPAIDWVKTLKGQGSEVAKLIEKGKSDFAGPEIRGKTLGVIGLGAIGILVANAARNLGMTVYGYDPYLSVDAAWNLSHGVQKAVTLEEIFANSDYITLHLPLTGDTRGMIGTESLSKMKDGVRILNFARGELVDSGAILDALTSGKAAAYATDFPTDELIGVPNVLAIPHLGASTPESEDNCARMAVDELKDYLENGNIRHSVNLPALSMPRGGETRICILHKNVPNTLASLTAVCGKTGINIEHMQSSSRGSYAYTMLDVTGQISETDSQAISALKEVIRIRVI